MKDLRFEKTYDGKMAGPQGEGFGSTHNATVDGRKHKDAVKIWSATPGGQKAAEDLLRKLGGSR